MKRLKSSFALAGIIILGLWSGGCDPEQAKYTFPHKPHHEFELSCDMCHELGETTVSMPSFLSCTTCHEADDEEVFGGCFSCHEQHNVEMDEDSVFKHGELFRKTLPAGWHDVKYNHGEYLDEDSDCLACHANIPESEFSSVDNLPSMEKSMDVHEEWGLSNDCAVCHLEVSLVSAPPSHDSNWPRQHGRVSEFFDKSKCLLCHQEATCKMCHQTQKPKDHTNLFRRKTHGIKATFDRARCVVCHREDECIICHKATAEPMPAAPYHTPGASCLSCHSPMAAKGPAPRPPQRFLVPMPHRMMMGVSSEKCLSCHSF